MSQHPLPVTLTGAPTAVPAADGAATPVRADLQAARAALVEAELAVTPRERFEAAHLCARRTAAVVLALRAPRDVRARARSGPAQVWTLLARTAPEYGEWAAFFAFTERHTTASARLADDLTRDAATFLALVENSTIR